MTSAVTSARRVDRAAQAASTVRDPELPELTIEDLGVLRSVTDEAGTVVVTVTPTFSGCPAWHAILADLDRALGAAAVSPYRIETALQPPWSSACISAAGREKLRRAGIAPPPDGPPDRASAEPRRGPVPVSLGRRSDPVPCPHCGAARTVLLSEYGATACRSLRRCEVCREPFDAVKAG